DWGGVGASRRAAAGRPRAPQRWRRRHLVVRCRSADAAPDRGDEMADRDRPLDFDWLVIGSGFGGSVAALRLAEKGYRVGVIECGRRFEDRDFPKSTWRLRRYFWLPRLG